MELKLEINVALRAGFIWRVRSDDDSCGSTLLCIGKAKTEEAAKRVGLEVIESLRHIFTKEWRARDADD